MVNKYSVYNGNISVFIDLISLRNIVSLCTYLLGCLYKRGHRKQECQIYFAASFGIEYLLEIIIMQDQEIAVFSNYKYINTIKSSVIYDIVCMFMSLPAGYFCIYFRLLCLIIYQA